MTRLRELITLGVIEKVQVPHPKRKGGFLTCIHLLSTEEKKTNEEDTLEEGSGESRE